MNPLFAAQTLAQVQNDYYEIIKTPAKFAIAELLSFEDFNIQHYCRHCKPHADADQLIPVVQAYAEEYGVWLDNAKYHVSCTLFLYPNARPDRMLTMMKNLTINFYLNDTIGRDVFQYLSLQEKEQAKDLIERMGSIDASLSLSPNPSAIERANIAVLKQFRDNSTEDWFRRFIQFYSYHISVTHKDCNAAAIGHVPDIAEYLSLRCHYGGMHHMLTWTEYGTGNFLNWSWLETVHLAEKLKQLYHAVAGFGALSNDLFSFENEVIDNSTDANLLMVIALNQPQNTLSDTIYAAASIVRNFLKEYITTLHIIKQQCHQLPSSAMLVNLVKHLENLDMTMQACWMWQVYTKRYKHSDSIFRETVPED